MSIFKAQWKSQDTNELKKTVKKIIKHTYYYVKPLMGFARTE